MKQKFTYTVTINTSGEKLSNAQVTRWLRAVINDVVPDTMDEVVADQLTKSTARPIDTD